LFVGAAAGFLETVQATGATGTYTRVGNTFCQTGNPIGVLMGTPNPVNVNQNVTFDASGSHEPTGACGTINSYTLNFGDGSPSITQSTPTGGGFSHAYTIPGAYPARLTVMDTSGLVSNSVTDIISVIGTPPVLSKVESWMFHGSITPAFKINLPLPVGTMPRGVESRTSASLGPQNYTMVFTFANNLVSVDGATIASGTVAGTPTVVVGPNASLGLNANQCQVNLTGVSNQQYVSVGLVNAKDSTGAIGTVTGPQMGVLIGDVIANGLVDGNDVAAVQSQTRQSVTSANFRDDVNANGLIDGNDVAITQAHTRTSLPSTP
jgi:PKD repeat protein